MVEVQLKRYTAEGGAFLHLMVGAVGQTCWVSVLSHTRLLFSDSDWYCTKYYVVRSKVVEVYCIHYSSRSTHDRSNREETEYSSCTAVYGYHTRNRAPSSAC